MNVARNLIVALTCLTSGAVIMAQGSYVPHRVYDTTRGAFTDLEVMLASAAKASVVFLGEQHDDPNTHRLELAVLEGLERRRRDGVILSLEMFERDVQEKLEHFMMGHVTEAEFLAESRPWPRYATDYKPLVDFAIKRHLTIVAANVPRSIASEVAKNGVSVLNQRPANEQAWFARERMCPTGDDDYFKRFMAAMGSHPGAASENYYFSQCLKDETMAESIVSAVDASSYANPVVVHVNGAFHSDFGLGTAARVKRRMQPPTQSGAIVVVSILPVEDLDRLDPSAEERARGDFLLYTLRK